MNSKKLMATTTTILSLSMMVLFLQTSGDVSQEVFAEPNQMTVINEIQRQDGVAVEFSVPETIVAGNLIPINAKVIDLNREANLSHTDWSYSIVGPTGEIVHRSTTLHGHFGVMNFKDSFPEAGTYTIKYTVSSSGPFMLGMSVPELGQTRAVVSGDLLKFEQDPKNNFGSRSFEFTVDVLNQGRTAILAGSEPGTSISVNFSTQPNRIVAGQPTTLLFDVNDAKTGKDATHVDGLIKIRHGSYYPSTSGDQPNIPLPIPLHGAYHGHLGVLSTTHTFSQPGTYMIDADLNVVPYSNPLFGQASTRFTIQVFEAGNEQETKQIVKENTVGIVGLESPFYSPNIIKVSAGQSITFDNVDGNQHTVTSVKAGTTDHDGKFDSNLLQPGEKFELTLKEKGTYNYYCSLHTNMRGTVIVS
ncbi:MAG TPA: plastocyanin/azurin family copper-binding protein [Nitrosopumilaceae archaeon]|nr:plastocyanin/azurin family copper-binding protein [Nitrosopumilaceae archaeon]